MTWLRKVELLEEDIRERGVIVLPRVHENFGVLSAQYAAEGSGLDELGSGTDDRGHFHERPELLAVCNDRCRIDVTQVDTGERVEVRDQFVAAFWWVAPQRFDAFNDLI